MENKDYTKRMNEYDSLINAIKSTRNLKTNFIGGNDNEKFYDKFDKMNARPRGIIYKPGTIPVFEDNAPRGLVVNERTPNGLTLRDITI